jgi:hypothetical protein
MCGVITITRAALSNGTGRSITWPATGAAKPSVETATTDNKKRITCPLSTGVLTQQRTTQQRETQNAPPTLSPL